MASKVATAKTAEERHQEAEHLDDSIAIQLEALTSTDGWATFLALATGFHHYSLNNLLLIMSQRPTATRVAGFRQWQARGRQVRKGETGIRIFGYATKKVEAAAEGDDDTTRIWFPVLSVFDITQTDPIDGVEPDLDIAPRLHGDEPHGIYAAVAEWLSSTGWTVSRQELHGEDGRTTVRAEVRTVTIESALEPAHAAVTILHEAAHALMHTDITDYHQHRGLYETEAESVAYVTAGVLGLDTSRNSIGYIASWTHGDPALLKLTAQRVLTTVRTILDAVTE
jgi:antirestriction protein ArdC